jgi:hypothetical protein
MGVSNRAIVRGRKTCLENVVPVVHRYSTRTLVQHDLHVVYGPAHGHTVRRVQFAKLLNFCHRSKAPVNVQRMPVGTQAERSSVSRCRLRIPNPHRIEESCTVSTAPYEYHQFRKSNDGNEAATVRKMEERRSKELLLAVAARPSPNPQPN